MPERVGFYIILESKTYGDHRLMYLLKQAKDVLKTREDEIKKYSITARAGGGINWDVKKGAVGREFRIPALVYQMVEDEIRKLDKDGKITEDLVDIANKILGEPDSDGKGKPKKK